MSSPDDYAAEQAAEYGKYVAAAPIFIGGARAFNPGDPVPISHVTDHPDWVTDGLVAEAGAAPAPDPVQPETPHGDDIPLDPTPNA